MIDILYIEYVGRTDDSLFVAQIVRTANEMSSTDNGTPTNKNNNKTNKDMNKQTVERLIKVSNWNDKLYTVIETKDNSYKCYGNIITGIEQLSLVDEHNKVIVLNIEDVIGIKVGDV